jgi:hypothetical protein
MRAQLTISAALIGAREVDKLICIPNANRELLDDDMDEKNPKIRNKSPA